ncbi:hypothetical protein K440DRAFT_643948 [Wilcoxina mikolae CBS 423.85]|nr:hypothetical protein K440DRAFT_643948 [Wilcoxina mikolae CBS 423.85]
MNTNNSLFDSYIRSVAASRALGFNGQFVGRKQLPNLCCASLPDQIQLGGSEYSKTQFLKRLGELLKKLNAYVREILVARPSPFPDPTPIRNLNEIRHVAVHRIPISEEKLFQLMEVGVRGTSLLEEWPALVKIQTLKTKVERWNEEMRSAEVEREKVWRRLEHLRETKREIEEEISQLEIQVDKYGIKEAESKIMRRLKAEVEDHFALSGED